MIELLPCPFCGGEAKQYHGCNRERILCTKCPAAMVGAIYTEEEIANAWNGKMVFKDRVQSVRFKRKKG